MKTPFAFHRYATVFAVAVVIAGMCYTEHVQAATPLTVQKMQNVTIDGHFFSTEITDSDRTVYSENPSDGRYVVLIVSATMPEGEGRIYGADFTLRYFHSDESEDRSICSAINISESTANEDMYYWDEFVVSNYGWVRLSSGRNRFALAFFIEPDVETIDLFRIGVDEPVSYAIGDDRPCSVFISSNMNDTDCSRARNVINQGGYNVIHVSNNLSGDDADITIHYRDQVETQAREISQRLMIEFGRTPVLTEMEMISEVDIVIWLGE